jgi:hypothetical protein
MARADWPQGHYSTMTFELQAQGQKTRLDFTQTMSLKIFMQISKLGWVERYWDNPAPYFG